MLVLSVLRICVYIECILGNLIEEAKMRLHSAGGRECSQGARHTSKF